MKRHLKHYGFVDWIERDVWWARLYVDGQEFSAEFLHKEHPLPEDRGEGSYLVLHKTKAGKWYFFWPRRIESNAKRKKRIKEARAMVRTLKGLID